MQNRSDSGTPCFSTRQTNMDVSSSRHHNIKVAKCTKYETKAYNFVRFLVRSQYFKFFFNYMS